MALPPAGFQILHGDRDRRILSRPVNIRWAGWETDTVKLQRNGWRLAVEFDPCDQRYRLLMNHEQLQLTAITDQRRIDYALSEMHNTFRRDMFPIFEVRHVAPTFEILRIQETGEPWNFNQINAEPLMTDAVVERLEDLNIFRLALDKAEEVVIDKADMTVIEHLQAIKALQSEKQHELREKARRERDRGEPSVSGEVVVQLIDYKQ